MTARHTIALAIFGNLFNGLCATLVAGIVPYPMPTIWLGGLCIGLALGIAITYAAFRRRG